MVVQTQHLDPQAASEPSGPFRAKNVCLVLTVGALEDAHVLHQAQNLQGDDVDHAAARPLLPLGGGLRLQLRLPAH